MKFKNFYAVVGFDGSGKSTVIATLTKLETNSASFHFIPKSYKERLGGDKKNLIHEQILSSGDAILIFEGGHGISILEDCKFLEFKQGPYYEEKDKLYFDK